MILNQDTFDLLREKYRVYDIETKCGYGSYR